MSDDAELAGRAARRGSDTRAAQDAFAELYQRHARPLIAFLASRVASSDLEDVHQVIWVRIWEALPNRWQGGHFRGWLFQIARNYLIDRNRRRREESGELPDRPDSDARTPEADLVEREEHLQLQHCLDQLPSDLQALVRGRLAGENYETLGPRLNVNTARAHKLFHDAKTRLQDCVQRGSR